MSYLMHDPYGEPEEVHTLTRAHEICAAFAEVAAICLSKIEEADSTDNSIFPMLDEIAKNWNHNATVIGRMKSDPAVRLAEEKARVRATAQGILEMAKACSVELPQLPE